MATLAPEAKRRQRLFETKPGEQPRLRCPRCRVLLSLFHFQPFGEVEEFKEETAPIYKCPRSHGGCGWIFALATPSFPDELREISNGRRKARVHVD